MKLKHLFNHFRQFIVFPFSKNKGRWTLLHCVTAILSACYVVDHLTRNQYGLAFLFFCCVILNLAYWFIDWITHNRGISLD